MNLLKACFKLAFTSPHPTFKMAALAYRGGSVISTATNGTKYGQHAELRTLNQYCLGANLIVVRLNGDHTSKPCRNCFEAILEHQINKLIFIENGQTVMIKPKNHFKEYFNGD